MGLERLHNMSLEQALDGSGRLKLPTRDAGSAPQDRKNTGLKAHILINFGFRQGETGGFNLIPQVTELVMLPDEKAVRINQRHVNLTSREYTLLAFISERKGVSIPQDVILEKVYKSKSKGAIRTQSHFLRRMLGDELTSNAIKNSQGNIRFGEFDPTKYYDKDLGEVLESQKMEVFPEKLIFYPDSGGIQIFDRTVELKSQEADLMALFATRVDTTISKETIHEFIWPGKKFSKSAVHTLVNMLRKKTDIDPQNPSMIQAVPGKGFRLTDPDNSKDVVENKIELLDDKMVVVSGANVRLIDIDWDFINLLRGCENGYATREVLSSGGLSDGYMRTMVWRLRRILGKDTIVRVKGGGWRLRVEKIADKRTPSEDE